MLSSVKPAAMMSETRRRFARGRDSAGVSQTESNKRQYHIFITDSQQGHKDQLQPGLFALKMNCR